MRGGYQTRQKEWISSALKDCAARAVTVDELLEAICGGGLTVGKTTVYRQLEDMVQAGKARKAQNAQGGWVYQFVDDISACAYHLHCQCIGCGRLTHVDCDRLDDLQGHLLADHGFRLDVARTMLQGRCAACGEGDRDGAADA